MSEHDRVIAYCSLVRSILEYACVVFAALQQYLSDSLERIQKGALAITFPGSSYSEALNLAGIATLQDPRSAACRKFIEQLKSDNPVYKLVASRLESTSASAHYSLRSREYELRKLIIVPQTLTHHYTRLHHFRPHHTATGCHAGSRIHCRQNSYRGPCTEAQLFDIGIDWSNIFP